MKSLRTNELASLIGVTPQTIRKYADNNTIPHHRRPSGQLYFTEEDIKEITGEKSPAINKSWVHYARSSSGDNKIIESQLSKLKSFYGNPKLSTKDKASRLNENRKGLKQLIKLAQNKEITDIAITRPDRLARFGYSYLVELFSAYEVTIHHINDDKTLNIEEELMQDFMSIIASFSGKYSQLRSRENKKKLLEKALEEVSDD